MIDIFQFIIDKLIDFCPENWQKVVFRAVYTEGSYEMKFYVYDGINTISCFDLKSHNKREIVNTFISIDKELFKARNEMCKDDKWSVMTMIVDNTGHMKTDFDYTDISENSIEYMRSWEQKFL